MEKDIYRVGKSLKRIRDEQNILTNNVNELLSTSTRQRTKNGMKQERMITASDWAEQLENHMQVVIKHY